MVQNTHPSHRRARRALNTPNTPRVQVMQPTNDNQYVPRSRASMSVGQIFFVWWLLALFGFWAACVI